MVAVAAVAVAVAVAAVAVAAVAATAVALIASYCGINSIRFDQSLYGIRRCNNKRSSTKQRRGEGALD